MSWVVWNLSIVLYGNYGSMEIPLSQEYIHMPEENIRCLIEVIDELVTSGQLVNSGQPVRI